MNLPTLIRHRQARGASPGEVAELEAAQARIETLEAALRDAQEALTPSRGIVPGVSALSCRIDALLRQPN